jgi:fimbrial chaperone protein
MGMALAGVCTAATAGTFSVTPVRIYMKPRDRAVAVTIDNEGDTEVALQADLNIWTQRPDGTDELVLSDEMILSPPIIKLAPRARQVVRLALLRPADPLRQLTYRLIIREVPEMSGLKEQGVQIPISLALSMPVFITPPAAKPEVACEASRADAQTLNAACANTGTAYAQVRELLVKRDGQVLARFEGGAYILPGARKIMSIKGEQAISPGRAQLIAGFDDGKSQTFDVTLP